ncbi:MAG: DUF4097 family beta strand repeat-containing protein [Phycisphaerales bacterium JB061]
MRNRAIIASTVLALAASTGSSIGCSVGWHSPNASVLSVMVADLDTSRAESVLAQTEAGDIELIATDGPTSIEAHIYAQTEQRADAARIRAEISDEGRLEISIDWPDGGRRENESCDIVARIPRMQGVWVRTGAGDVDVAGMAGEMRIETGAGDIDVDRHEGKVAATTSAGDITLKDVSGPVSASTGAGDVDLELVRGPVDASTSAGDIHATLTKSFQGTIIARASVGDLRVMGREYRERHATVRVGDSPENSRFETSVGDIVVRTSGD